jgi:hypothetical protein
MPEFVGLEKPPARKHGTPRGSRGKHSKLTQLEALIALLQAEIAELKSGKGSPGGGSSGGSPSSKGGSSSSSGGNPSSKGGSSSSSAGGSSSSANTGGASASPILQTTSTQLIVTVNLDASKQSEARVGEPVTVQLPNGTAVAGRISAVSPVAQSSSNSNDGNGNGNGNGNNAGGSGSTIPVTITLASHHTGAGLDQAAVSVNFSEARANNVLSVPVTALLATAGGGYAVQKAAAPHDLVPVTTGLFAAGYVQISGPGIYPGLAVTDSQG